jgi:PIN domain nuclease of toxin-antitoxin system
MVFKITIDTHALIWYLDKDLSHRLSDRALQTIRKATESGLVFIPTIVLIEVADLIDRDRVNLPYENFINAMKESENYQIVPFDEDLLELAVGIKGFEIHDRVIVATAMMTDSILVSKDGVIKNKFPNTLW